MSLKSQQILSHEELSISNFTTFVESHRLRLIAYARTYVGDSVVCEDIVMEAMMAVWAARERLNINSALPYALTSVKNKCFNHLRALKIRHQANSAILEHEMRILNLRIATLEDTVPEKICSEESQQIIYKSINSLPEKTRQIFIMSKIDDKSYKFIADEMGITVKSVEYELVKAMKLLRQKLCSTDKPGSYNKILFGIILVHIFSESVV